MNLELIVWTGTTLLLIGFVLNQLNIWKNDSLQYDLINFIGGAMLAYYAFAVSIVPFVIINGVWAAVSLKDLINRFR